VASYFQSDFRGGGGATGATRAALDMAVVINYTEANARRATNAFRTARLCPYVLADAAVQRDPSQHRRRLALPSLPPPRPRPALGARPECQMGRAHEAALVGPNSTRTAQFVRAVVIPSFVRAMRLASTDVALPVVVCRSIGKVTDSTLWIVDELAAAVREAFGADITLGTTGVAERELAAVADLAMLLGTQDVVLFPGSSFSSVASVHLMSRGARIGYIADLRSRCFGQSGARIAKTLDNAVHTDPFRTATLAEPVVGAGSACLSFVRRRRRR
jgi:hypothetical protein